MTTSVATAGARGQAGVRRRLDLRSGLAAAAVLAGYAGLALLLFGETWRDPGQGLKRTGLGRVDVNFRARGRIWLTSGPGDAVRPPADA